MAVLDRTLLTSLTDEKVDTHILGIDSIAEAPTGITFEFGDASKKVAGVEKLAGIFLKKLFTLKNSNPIDLNEGTSFATLLGSNISDEEDLLLIIQDAISDAAEQVIEEQGNQDLPLDEKLASAKLYNMELVGSDRIEVYIDLISLAGTRAVIKVPKVELS